METDNEQLEKYINWSLLEHIPAGSSLTKNCHGEWTASVYEEGRGYVICVHPKSGPAGLFKTPERALQAIYDYYDKPSYDEELNIVGQDLPAGIESWMDYPEIYGLKTEGFGHRVDD